MIRAKRSFVKKIEDWVMGIGRFEHLYPCVSLKKEQICREISENRMLIYKKNAGLRSRKFMDLNSACLKVLVHVKIFQVQDMYNGREQYWDATNDLIRSRRSKSF